MKDILDCILYLIEFFDMALLKVVVAHAIIQLRIAAKGTRPHQSNDNKQLSHSPRIGSNLRKKAIVWIELIAQKLLGPN